VRRGRMEDEKWVKLFILSKLFRRNTWGGKHTSIDNMPKGLPSHLRGYAKDIAKSLVNDEFLIGKPTNTGLHVSLNPRKREAILKLIRDEEQ